MHTRIRTTMTMVIAVSGVLLVANPASATPSTFGALVPSTFTEEYSTVTVPASDTQDAVAACPAGKAAVSVGGLTTVGVGGSAGLDKITPGPDHTTGVATARADRSDIGRTVVAQATCAPTAQFAGTTFATREQRAHSVLGEWTQTVTCPAGMRAFGGGGYFRASGGTVSKSDLMLNANSPTLNGRGWTVSAQDRTFTDTLVVTTRCAFQSTSTRLVEEVYPIPSAPGTHRTFGYAHCAAGFLPISGGAVITQDGSPAASGSVIMASVSVRNGQIGWFANGFSEAGEHANLHVIALCGV